jgi:choline dehydrogenase-like flavoprotein
MIRDVRSLGGLEPAEADLCIIGAGAAGIAIAREFISSPYRVVVLESGGLRRERSVQQLYSGDSVGEHYFQPLDVCRTRYFGGSTNCWCGICRPLDPIDFEQRFWIPWSGWPVAYQDLEPFLARAHHLASTGPDIYDDSAWDRIGLNPGQFDPALLRPMVWHFNSRAAYELSFGKRFRAELRRAANVEVLLHANVVELLTDRNGRVVTRARIRAFDGSASFADGDGRNVVELRAKRFILASGGIENARILLASTSTQRDGLGNGRGLVGRFFHEHLQAPCGMLIAPRAGGLASQYSRLHRFGGTACLPGFGLSPAAQTAFGTPNASISIEPVFDKESAVVALQKVRQDIRRQHISGETLKRLCRAALDCREWAPAAWTRFVRKDRPAGDPRRFIVYARSEQVPNPDSRVVLSREKDELGMPRAVLDWRTTELDHTGIRLIVSHAAKEFQRLGIGELIPAAWVSGPDWPEDLVGGPHHMGSTRMSHDPATGVVDKDCKVHGLDGLYVAGSSVFPTGGHANPTLSILTLALRLADHVRESLQCESVAETTGATAMHSIAGTSAE